MSSNEARDFFLKAESYCTIDLPPYVVFDEVLKKVSSALSGRMLSSCGKGVRDYDDVNYTILHNKNGRYTWRPFDIIHPAIYVALVHAITQKDKWTEICKRFEEFQKNKRIKCLSLPVESKTNLKDQAEQVLRWWQTVEQRAIELSLEYKYVISTDITDCYGSIYTHSIPWALHTKKTAKDKKRDKGLIGNIIDSFIQDMRNGQTNGIPQGSVLMDFIAEIVLGYADLELYTRISQLKTKDYQVLRYRDDYRIFVNDPNDGDAIAKILTEVLADTGLKLNSNKTFASADLIKSSIKADKLDWVGRKQRDSDFQKHLLIIHDHAARHPNSGSLVRALISFHKRISKSKLGENSIMPMIAIIVDIAFHSPRTYAVCAAILSILIQGLKGDIEKKKCISAILNKFRNLPNTGMLQIWLQRISYFVDKNVTYNEGICRLVCGDNVELWNNSWINCAKLKNAIDKSIIVDSAVISSLTPVIKAKEFEMFESQEYYS